MPQGSYQHSVFGLTRRLDSIPFSNPQMSQLAPELRCPSPLLHDRAVLEDLEFRAYRAHLLLPEEP
jgi:hypothetical protein